MGWLSDIVEDAVDYISEFFSDPFTAAFGWFEAAVDFITAPFKYVADQLNSWVMGQLPEQEYESRTRTLRSADAPRQVAYGQVRTGGHLVFAETSGADDVVLWLVFVLAGHECYSVDAVYAENRKIAEGRPDRTNGRMPRVNSGKFKNTITCWSVRGNQEQALVPSVDINFPGASYVYDGVKTPVNWTEDHKLSYQTYVIVALGYDKDVYSQVGVPTFKFDFRGKSDIYDPRDGTIKYTDNQALCVLDSLLWPRLFGSPQSEINMDSFIEAANIADELVPSGPGGATEKRYTVNGTFSLQTTPGDIIRSLAQTGASQVVYSQGLWSIVPGAFTAPVLDLYESDFIGGLSFEPGPGKQDRHNKGTGTYVDPSQEYETVGFPEIRVEEYVQQDGEVLEKSYKFPFVASGTQARRLVKIDLDRNRFGLTVKGVFKFKAMQLTAGDRVNLWNTRLGWSPKVFRVAEIEASFQAGIKLTLREDAASIYNWEEGDALALLPPPILNIPDGIGTVAPADVQFSEELYRTLTRSAVKVRMILTWGEVPSATSYDIQYRKVGEALWIPAASFFRDTDLEIDDVDDGDYEIRIRSVTLIGRRSDWLEYQYTVVGKSEPPADVTNLFLEKGKLKWQYDNAPLDLAGFLIRFQNGDRQLWADASPAHENVVTETVFDVSQYSGVKTFLLKAVDTTGNESATPAILVTGLGDPLTQNVIEEQNEAPGWTGTITNGFVNAEDELEAEEVGGFYGDPSAPFYAQDSNVLFYSAEYLRLEYEFTFEVLAADVGADLTVVVEINGSFNEKVDYIPPGYAGGFIPFPGNVPALEGVYTFRLSVPQQQLPGPPQVTNISTRLDVEDIEESFEDAVIDAAGTRLAITKSYRAIKTVNLTLQDDGGTASSIKILDKDPINGPLVRAFNSAGTGVAATIDAEIQGY